MTAQAGCLEQRIHQGYLQPVLEADAVGTTVLDVAVQTRTMIASIRDIPERVGSGLHQLVEVQALLVDLNDVGAYSVAYGDFFNASRPTRPTVAVRQLPHPHLRIEIRAVAYAPPSPSPMN